MNYQDKQKENIRNIEEAFKRGETPSTIVVPVADFANDEQICLTSVAFVSSLIRSNIIDKVVEPLRALDNRQYFYPPEPFHVTIQNIRVINNPPHFGDEEIERAKEVFEKVIPKHSSIKFHLKGLFELPTSLAIPAYTDESFGDLVLELRQELERAGAPDDKKYASEVVLGSSTIFRYTTQPNDAFVEKIRDLKEIELGEFIAEKVNLITANSVCHPGKTKILGEYSLGNSIANRGKIFGS